MRLTTMLWDAGIAGNDKVVGPILGDAIEVLPTLAEGTVDLLLTDPPYAMPATYYQGRHVRRRWSDSSIMSGWWRLVMEKVKPTLKPNAMLCVCADAGAVAAFWPIMYEMTTWLSVAVWDKGRFGFGGVMRMQTEFVIVGAVGDAYGSSKGFSNVLKVGPVPPDHRDHPAQKPHDLVAKLIEQFCVPGGHVLDPFAGSNVTARAAATLGRTSTSIEWEGEHEEALK